MTFGGLPLLAMLNSFRKHATVPVFVHLDHSTREEDIVMALEGGVDSIMVDGSAEPLEENIEWTARMVTESGELLFSFYLFAFHGIDVVVVVFDGQVALAHSVGVAVEGELGRLTGEEVHMTNLTFYHVVYYSSLTSRQDGTVIAEYEARMTDAFDAGIFVAKTKVRVCLCCSGGGDAEQCHISQTYIAYSWLLPDCLTD